MIRKILWVVIGLVAAYSIYQTLTDLAYMKSMFMFTGGIFTGIAISRGYINKFWTWMLPDSPKDKKS